LHRAVKVLALMAALAVGGVASAAPKGDCGTIVMPTGAGQAGADDLTSFNPLYADTAYNQEAGWLMYPDLLWINRFSDIDWSRSLASAVTTTDNQTFTVTMRPWHWSDGVPVTASDAVYFFTLAKKLGSDWVGFGSGGLPTIVKSITVLSPTQFQIVTTHPVNPTWFIYNGIGQIQPLPEHAWKKYDLDQMYQAQSEPAFFQPVDGPLMLKSLDVGIDATFVPNPAWEGSKMHFTQLVFRFQQGDGAGVQGVASGTLDEAQLPTDLYREGSHFPGTHVEVLGQQTYQNFMNLNFRNPADSFFHDVRVRQAMADAIDQTSIVEGLQHGAGDPAHGPVLVTMTKFLTPAMRDGIYPVGYDPAKARALLAEAGWKPGPDGIMMKDGKRLEFTFLLESGTDAIQELYETVQADFLKVGIDMKIRTMEFNQIIAMMAGQPLNWDVAGAGLPVAPYPSGENNFESTSFQNFEHYNDPEADKLIEANISSPDPKYLYEFETYISQQQPGIFLPRSRPVLIVRNRLHGLNDFIDPVGMYAPDQLYCTAP
jgi:peptide/nickel transport system substrate-binding protein